MDHAARAVTALDLELVQAGDAAGAGEAARPASGSVRPVRVVEILVLPQDDHQMPLVPDLWGAKSLPGL